MVVPCEKIEKKRTVSIFLKIRRERYHKDDFQIGVDWWISQFKERNVNFKPYEIIL